MENVKSGKHFAIRFGHDRDRCDVDLVCVCVCFGEKEGMAEEERGGGEARQLGEFQDDRKIDS